MITEEELQKGRDILEKMGREDSLHEQEDTYDEMFDLSLGYLWGQIWQRPHLSLRDRQIITLAANIALARPSGNHSHYRSARKIGMSHDEICEIMIHVGMYAGWPTMAHANRQYREVLAQDRQQGSETSEHAHIES
jgi:alkylhydroperoxidase/carboxymuconolactone decarboxylase family protein YurZ